MRRRALFCLALASPLWLLGLALLAGLRVKPYAQLSGGRLLDGGKAPGER
jgi:hypothetical protein